MNKPKPAPVEPKVELRPPAESKRRTDKLLKTLLASPPSPKKTKKQ